MEQIAWRKMHQLVPASRCGIAEVKHWSCTEKEARVLNETPSKDPYTRIAAGTYAALTLDLAPDLELEPTVYMSDVPGELESCQVFLEHAHGRVFIAGLGLGVILWPLLDMPGVDNVLVIEKYQDVIDLVEPSLAAHPCRKKLSVVRADILDWQPEQGCKFNTLFFDIWPNRAVENLLEIRTLHSRGWRWLDPSDAQSWMGSWYARELRLKRRRERYFLRNVSRIIPRLYERAAGRHDLVERWTLERCAELSATAARELLQALHVLQSPEPEGVESLHVESEVA